MIIMTLCVDLRTLRLGAILCNCTAKIGIKHMLKKHSCSGQQKPGSRYMQQILLRMALLIAGVMGGTSAYAALSASVSMALNGSGAYSANIYPGDTTYLQVILSNSGTTTATGVTFSHAMTGAGANGLLVAGAPTYTCTTAAGVTSAGGGTLTATTGQHGVSLSGGVIPPRAKNASNIDVDGYCSIILPVTVQTY
ncbi:MAG: hypothetical protein ACRCTU_11920, partial [Zoogloea sp.]|uniref:hypothetical protein n=1 Tax=Zoogloea sp. TaxID=49181 RepID=UPI003F3140DB